MDGATLVQPDGKAFRQMYLICAQLPITLALLTFVLWFMGNEGWDGPPATPPGVQIVVFAILAIAVVPLAFLVRNADLRRGGLVAGSAPLAAPDGTPLTAAQVAVSRITMSAIVGMAIPEVSVLLGFVLGFQMQSWSVYIPFAAWSVLGWIIMYPRPSQVRAWYSRQTQHDMLPQPNVLP